MKFIGECGINRCEVFGKRVIFVEEFGDEFEIGIVSDNVEVIKNEEKLIISGMSFFDLFDNSPGLCDEIVESLLSRWFGIGRHIYWNIIDYL